ncbi:protein C-mannosyl-transferase DPY19L3-like isoform X2 [Diadema setosum]|uniref:protein C-mannosyl-transferase DPY19L3-like isoform X2 n=2 Tax=Diadema setosum TaxID=31175 RepID=UPI003B3B5BA8
MNDEVMDISSANGPGQEDRVRKTSQHKPNHGDVRQTEISNGQRTGKVIDINGKNSGQVNGRTGHAAHSNGHPNGHHSGPRNGRLVRNGRSCTAARRVRRPQGWQRWLTLACGMCVGFGAGAAYSCFLYMLHENRLWFTNIKEVEREISFRTESGLYYSYYKQFLHAPTVSQGFYELTHDNITENWRTINVLERFNIYQEVFLALIYRSLPFIQSRLLPIFFYINTVFVLHGVYFTSLFATAWLLTNSWLAGLLACTFFIANKDDTTRVDYTIPLRESFALPFLYVQLALITHYLRPSPHAKRQMVSLGFAAVFTFLFVLTWQFSQFVLLLQAMALYAGNIAGLIPKKKVTNLLYCHLSAILGVCLLQFFNKMLLGSLAFAFGMAALLDFRLQVSRPVPTSLFGYAVLLMGRVAYTAVGTFSINFGTKFLLRVDADQHIFKFLTAKFGLTSARDFDVLLYKCHGAFSFLPMEALWRLTSSLLFPLYIAVVFGLLSILIVAVFQNWSERLELSRRKKDDDTHAPSSSGAPNFSSPAASSSVPAPPPSLVGIIRRPDLAFHTLQTIPFGLMAFLVLRMKFVWTPQMCVLAAFGVGNGSLWRWLLGKLGCKSDTTVQCVRHGVAIALIAISLYRCYPGISYELTSLREFYDPDTVELMNWISQQTPKTAVFSGSMQLLAGVKLCTGRRLTNHPHYEDKRLRDNTVKLYQYYARRSAQDVYDIHRAIGTDFIILEDSICYARSSEVGCRLPDILDIINGHLYSGANPALEPTLKPTNAARFCDAIKKGGQDYDRLFKLVFHNRTFRVYRLLREGDS